MKHSFRFLLVFLVAALAFGSFVGCSKEESTLTTPSGQTDLLMNASNPLFQRAMAIQDKNTAKLMADPDVIGTATTIGDDGKPAIMVLVLTEKAKLGVPTMIEDVGVQVVLTDRVVAMGTAAVSHTAKQTPPIQLGTSGGWRYDLANGYCCGGTLGSLIKIGTQMRILSNYHVFEADIVSGGNSRVAATGDYIIQPGLIDVGCVRYERSERGYARQDEQPAEQQRRLLQRDDHHRHGQHDRRDPRGRNDFRHDDRRFRRPAGQEERAHDGSHPEQRQRPERHHQRHVRE